MKFLSKTIFAVGKALIAFSGHPIEDEAKDRLELVIDEVLDALRDDKVTQAEIDSLRQMAYEALLDFNLTN